MPQPCDLRTLYPGVEAHTAARSGEPRSCAGKLVQGPNKVQKEASYNPLARRKGKRSREARSIRLGALVTWVKADTSKATQKEIRRETSTRKRGDGRRYCQGYSPKQNKPGTGLHDVMSEKRARNMGNNNGRCLMDMLMDFCRSCVCGC